MDPFSHILLGYLLGFGLWGPAGLQYVVAAAFAGALPDADVLFYPLSNRFPLLRHRGLSHSLVGVTIVAAVGTFVVPQALAWSFGPSFGSGSPIYFFVALEIGGLSHVLLDAMDHWSVPIFAPFSEHEFHFDADRIVNLGAMSFTVLSYATMIYERGRVAIWVWQVTAWVLLAAVLAYFVVRLVARWRVERIRVREHFDAVIPQADPSVFVLFGRTETDGGWRLRTARYELWPGRLSETIELDIPREPPSGGPILTASEALTLTYPLALRASWILGETHHFGVVKAGVEGFEVFWYSLEMAFFGRAAGVVVRIDAQTRGVSTKTTWRNPVQAYSTSR